MSDNPTQQDIPAPVRGLAIVAVYVSDMERARAFYTRVLGFAEAAEQMLEPGITLQAGDASIYLHGGRTAAGRPNHDGPEISLCLVARGIDACHQRLLAAGVEIVEYNPTSEAFASLLLNDPDGNLLQLWGPR